MEWSHLELKVISCSDVKSFHLFQKPSAYAVVSIINGELKKKQQRQNCLQRQKTPVDRVGGRNPEWNHVMNFDIKALVHSCSHLFVSFDLYCEGVIYGTNSIGKVRVPLKDLIDEFNGAVRFVRYQVRSSDGKPNGVFSFCYKLKGMSINTHCKENRTASPEVQFSSTEPETQFSSKQIQYPRIELEVFHEKPSPGIYYPPPGYVNSPLPVFYNYSPTPPNYHCYKATEVYNNNTSPGPSSYYHPCPPLFVQSPGPYFVYRQ